MPKVLGSIPMVGWSSTIFFFFFLITSLPQLETHNLWNGGWSSTIGDKALCHNLWWVGLSQLETLFSFCHVFCHKSWQVILFVSSTNAYKLAFYEEKRIIPKSPTIPIPKIPFCNPIEREPRELKRGEKNRE